MAYVVKESIEAHKLGIHRDGGLSGTREFILISDVAVTLAEVGVSIITGLPKLGDLFPVGTATVPYPPACDGIDFAFVDAGNSASAFGLVIRVTCEYHEKTAAPADDGGRPDEPGYIATSTDFSVAIVDMYRLIDPPAGTIALLNPPETDIGGTAKDSNGKPKSQILGVQTFSITNVINGRPNYQLYRNMTGQRNSAVFQSGAIGYWAFLGAKCQRVGVSTYSVTWDFAYDPWGHCRQVPKVNPATEEVQTIAVSGVSRAELVYWVQPIPYLANFSTLGIVGL